MAESSGRVKVTLGILGVLFASGVTSSCNRESKEDLKARVLTAQIVERARIANNELLKQEAEAKAKAEADEKARIDAENEKEVARLTKLSAAGRLKEAKASAADCVNNNVCDENMGGVLWPLRLMIKSER